MNQTRLQSLLEAWINVVVGYWVAVASQLLIFPLFGVRLALYDNLLIGGYFTLISLLRGFAIRRWFNARLLNKEGP